MLGEDFREKAGTATYQLLLKGPKAQMEQQY